MKTIFFNILLNPAFLALIISLIIIWFLPPIFEKYEAAIVEKSMTTPNGINYFVDLDHDGRSERINMFSIVATNYRTGIIVYTKEKIIDQWNFNSTLTLSTSFEIYSGDYDNNGFNEVLFLTYREDSIFLNLLDPFNPKKPIINERFITYRINNKEIADFSVHFAGFSDLNQDGYKEVVFTLFAGFPREPRQTYSYDIHNDVLRQSPQSCALMSAPLLFDLDKDGVDEILIGFDLASGNCSEETSFSDHYLWLMVFDKMMNFYFEPIIIGEYPSRYQAIPLSTGDKTYIAVLFINNGQVGKNSAIRLYDISGNLITEKKLDNYIIDRYSFLLSENDNRREKLFLLLNTGQLLKIDAELNITPHKKITKAKALPYSRQLKMDVDNDGEKELLFWNRDNQELIIVRSDFHFPVGLSVQGNILMGYSVNLRGEEKPQLNIQFDDFKYIIEYGENPLYVFEYLIYLAVFGVILLLVWVIQKAQAYRIKQQLAFEKQLIELQLKTVKSQLDPHFTLNLIASIGDLFDKKDSKQANYVFSKYSTLLRQSLLSSDKFTISLNEELEFVDNYLSLEQFRFNHKFDFKIVSKEEAKAIHIPKMLVHSFVENAVKHGIRHLDKQGVLEVIVTYDENMCMVTIKDNGIGRGKAREMDTSGTGRGISIVDQIIKNYNKLKKGSISYTIKDLYEKDKALGTQVIITIPI